jgi:hypothetical protein
MKDDFYGKDAIKLIEDLLLIEEFRSSIKKTSEHTNNSIEDTLLGVKYGQKIKLQEMENKYSIKHTLIEQLICDAVDYVCDIFETPNNKSGVKIDKRKFNKYKISDEDWETMTSATITMILCGMPNIFKL